MPHDKRHMISRRVQFQEKGEQRRRHGAISWAQPSSASCGGASYTRIDTHIWPLLHPVEVAVIANGGLSWETPACELHHIGWFLRCIE